MSVREKIRKHARHNYISASAEGYLHIGDQAVTLAAEHASRQLLVAQLKTGQHGLREEQFWDRVRELKAGGHL